MAVAIGIWSVAVTPGEPTTFVPEGDIRITNCALGEELADEKRTTLKLSYLSPAADDSDDEEDEEEDEDDEQPTLKTTVLCSLTGSKIEQASVDVVLEEGQEYLLEIVGANTIYVTGNYIDQTPPTDLPPFDDEDEEDDYDLRDLGSDLGGEGASDDDMETDGSRFEELAEEAKSGKRPRASDAMDADEASASDKKAKKLKGANGEAAPAPEEEKQLSKKEKKKLAKEKKANEAATPATENKSEKKDDKAVVKELAGGVKVKDAKVGSGPQAKTGNTVSMRYIGKLQNGHVFDKNTKGKPFTFQLGGGEVIKGWDIGIAGMQVGGERLLTIPPNMAYGKRKMGDIPPNSTLTFEVKLIEIK